MQTNRLLITPYSSVNNSEKYLRIFYRKSKTEKAIVRLNTTRLRMLKKFVVHTEEQMVFFEEMFDLAYYGFIARLKQYPFSLTATERTLIAFLKINLCEKEMARNLGYSIEEVKRNIFCLCKKLQVHRSQLLSVIHSI